ncbi:hypothetical protein SISSUDRAFT_1048316 [Sistotremastrum suecicum HHB10207 ss-3]|uniref:Uncharacterized protein n=1 Tax=Sistotremastrum suecicum HHB10207 ss-3 TaxID=1314776 RepID=A0A166CKY2_9AGAM|nr:hypothetical protein SISSUDRAFT_1048316 [Sistotremastrum suecicum HHB10207 ss-3]
MSTLPTQQPVDDAFKSNDSTYSNPRPIAAATSLATPAPDIHDTPLFHQLIGIIQEHNATAKEQRDIMQGMRRSLELLQEQSSIRPLQRGIDESIRKIFLALSIF